MTIPDSLTSIGDYAFSHCTSLTSITIPNSVINIGRALFAFCSRLTVIEVDPQNPAYSSLDGVLFNKSHTVLVAFPGGKARSYEIPTSANDIGDGAFSYCTSLTNVVIPSSVTSIGVQGFSGCTSLANVTIPDSVTSIGFDAFSSCTGLTSVRIGSGVTNMVGASAFGYCTSLTAITVDTLNPAFSSLDGVLFNKSQSTLLEFPAGKAGGYTIPNSVTSIGDNAFSYCTSLSSVTIPDSVTSIGYEAFYSCTSPTNITIGNGVTSIGNRAFHECTSLISITVDALNPAYSSMDGALFNKSQTTLIQFPGGKPGSYAIPNSVTSIGGGAFSYCISLTSVVIPSRVTGISWGAFFGCASLSNITIPDTVTRIDDYAFYGCTSLTSITIPNSVAYIGFAAFVSCTNLTAVYFEGNAFSDDISMFDGDNDVVVYYLPCAEGWGTTFAGRPATLWYPPAPYAYSTNNGAATITIYYCPTGAVVIPDTIEGLPVTSIGYRAFAGRTSLTDVTIPNSVTTIGGEAFSGCSSLTSVTIPNSVTSIGDGRFKLAMELSEFEGAFAYCTDLTNLVIGESLTNIGTCAFFGCSSLINVRIPHSVTSIGEGAFYSCTGLTNVTIGNGVTSIEHLAFWGCTSLTTVYCRGNAPGPGLDVFDDDINATVYHLPGTTGWGTTFGGRPTALWVLPYPVIITTTPDFGIQTHLFGFRISWATNVPVVVEASATLANADWSPASTNALTDGWCYFSDAEWTNCPARFYRIRQW